MPVQYVERDGLRIHPDEVASLHAAGLDSLDAMLGASGEASLTKRGLADWRERVVLSVGGSRLYLKRFRRPPDAEQRRRRTAGFSSTAMIERHWIDEVAAIGVPCPKVVAVGERLEGDAEIASVLVTAAVPGVSLESWVRSPAAVALQDRALRTRLIEAAADVTRRLHYAGLFHRDYYLAHLFLDLPADEPLQLRITLIDLQRMVRSHRRTRWATKDLASMHYSAPRGVFTCSDRVRFYRRYVGRERLSWRDRIALRLIVAKARRIARHSRKHGLG
jgi:hypothetical protein